MVDAAMFTVQCDLFRVLLGQSGTGAVASPAAQEGMSEMSVSQRAHESRSIFLLGSTDTTDGTERQACLCIFYCGAALPSSLTY